MRRTTRSVPSEGLKRIRAIRDHHVRAAALAWPFQRERALLRRAIERLQERNPNPYDGEPYNLGLSLTLQGRYDEAVDAYYKSVWNAAWQERAFRATQLAAMRGDFGP